MFMLKKLVWEKGELIGIYEIIMFCGEWLEGILVWIVWVVGFVGVFFILLYGIVFWLLFRKFFCLMRYLMG